MKSEDEFLDLDENELRFVYETTKQIMKRINKNQKEYNLLKKTSPQFFTLHQKLKIFFDNLP